MYSPRAPEMPEPVLCRAASGGGVAAGGRVGELGEAAITDSAGSGGAIIVATSPGVAADTSAGKGPSKRKGKGSKKLNAECSRSKS